MRDGGRGNAGSWRPGKEPLGGSLHLGDVAVPKAPLGVPGVVSGQGDPQSRLIVFARLAPRSVAMAQHDGGCGEVATRVKGLLDAEAEPVEIGAVDLGQAQIQIGALGEQVLGDPRRLRRGVHNSGKPGTVVDADGQRVKPAFHIGDRGQRLRRHGRCTGLGDGDDGGEVEHGGTPMSPQPSASLKFSRPACLRPFLCGRPLVTSLEMTSEKARTHWRPLTTGDGPCQRFDP